MKIADLVQSADWKAEKHVPVIEAPDTVKAGARFTVKACVGLEIPHPNTTEHHIRWIKLYFKPENAKFGYELGQVEFSTHGESIEGANKGPLFTEPFASIDAKLTVSGTLVAVAYCNIHGLWESAKPIAVEA